MAELLRKQMGISVTYRVRPDTKNPEHLAGVCRVSVGRTMLTFEG